MGRTILSNKLKLLPWVYQGLAFLYVLFIIHPQIYFHHDQTPFILSSDFLKPFPEYPGGISEWIANLVMQAFHSGISGPLVFFLFSLGIYFMVKKIMDSLYTSEINSFWALLPFSLSILVVNNYNFPYSVIISLTLLLGIILLLVHTEENPGLRFLILTMSAPAIYYISGSGYLLLFALVTVVISFSKKWKSLPEMLYIIALAVIIPVLGQRFIFTDFDFGKFPFLFSEEIYFKAYRSSFAFHLLLLSLPVLTALSLIFKKFDINAKPSRSAKPAFTILSLSIVLPLVIIGHFATYQPDAHKISASDFYCYKGNIDRALSTATSIKDYSFLANMNFNLAVAKSGRINKDFFNFLQISGVNALYPDVDFSAEMAFISADFYYDLGYISEARHWAYEALVFYPYSPRALKLLVKIHLVTGEYKAAERSLHILGKGLINGKFLEKYYPMVIDTGRIQEDPEIMQKRSFMPGAHELNPYPANRFMELLEVNPGNKRAYEYLMLYFLLDGDLENFLEFYQKADQYFEEPQPIYEDAILMYDFLKDKKVSQDYTISPATLERYKKYMEYYNQYRNDERMARNVLYHEMGKTSMFYLQFVEPRIILPEIMDPEHEEPGI